MSRRLHLARRRNWPHPLACNRCLLIAAAPSWTLERNAAPAPQVATSHGIRAVERARSRPGPIDLRGAAHADVVDQP